MKFAYRTHFKFRAKQRKIPVGFAKRVYNSADGYYIDKLRNRHIVVGSISFKNKMRTFAVVYDIIEETVEFITIHELSKRAIQNKLNSGRWQHEKN